MNTKIIVKWITHVSVIFMIASCCTCDKAGSDDDQALVLEPVGTFENAGIIESSGIVKSKNHAGLFWTHNDSNNDPANNAVLYPVYTDGTSGSPAAITISDATNIDWEDITMDGDGNIYVGDIGNNTPPYFERDNLCLYQIPEPDLLSSSVSVATHILFTYPGYPVGAPDKYNYDAEAIFWARDTVYLLTKHYFDSITVLYRFDDLSGTDTTTLDLVAEFNTEGSVSAADASPDGNRLAVLANVFAGFPSTDISSSIVWLFEVVSGDDYFNGTKYRLRIDAGQCEAICFMDDDTLLITNEEEKLFMIYINQLIPVK